MTDKKWMASSFNNFFIEIGEQITKGIPGQTQNLANNGNINRNLNSIFLEDVRERQIEEVISSPKNNTSPGRDSVTTKILKLIYKHISNLIPYVINLMFNNSIIPEIFKESIVIPIYNNVSKMI